jgi:hypothetical protein
MRVKPVVPCQGRRGCRRQPIYHCGLLNVRLCEGCAQQLRNRLLNKKVLPRILRRLKEGLPVKI